MNRSALATILATIFAILSALGIADSWYLAYNAVTNTALTCNINGLSGCNIVEQSEYSRLFGIPLGIYGVVFYAVFFILSVLLFVKTPRLVRLGLLVLSWIGLIASAVFEWIQVEIIKALCVYCLGSAIISLLLCILATWLYAHMQPRKAIPEPILPSPTA